MAIIGDGTIRPHSRAGRAYLVATPLIFIGLLYLFGAIIPLSIFLTGMDPPEAVITTLVFLLATASSAYVAWRIVRNVATVRFVMVCVMIALVGGFGSLLLRLC